MKLVNEKKKPPIGIVPRKLWLRNRTQEIVGAIRRYSKQGLPCPEEWAKELEYIVTEQLG
jgi:hypothetical protein